MTESSAASTGSYIDHRNRSRYAHDDRDRRYAQRRLHSDTNGNGYVYALVKQERFLRELTANRLSGRTRSVSKRLATPFREHTRATVAGGGGYSLAETGGTMIPGSGTNIYSLTETANVLDRGFQYCRNRDGSL